MLTKDEYRKALAKEQRALYEEKDKHLIAAIIALPGRSSALLTVSGAVATLLASAAVFGAHDWINQVANISKIAIFMLFGSTLVLVLIAVWIVIGSLQPIAFLEFEPNPTFVDDALSDLAEDVENKVDVEMAIDLYIAAIAKNRIDANSHRLDIKHQRIACSIWLLRCAFFLGILQFVFSVIIQAGW